MNKATNDKQTIEKSRIKKLLSFLLSFGPALFAIRRHLPVGQIIAITILLTVGIGQWNSLIGILGITAYLRIL